MNRNSLWGNGNGSGEGEANTSSGKGVLTSFFPRERTNQLLAQVQGKGSTGETFNSVDGEELAANSSQSGGVVSLNADGSGYSDAGISNGRQNNDSNGETKEIAVQGENYGGKGAGQDISAVVKGYFKNNPESTNLALNMGISLGDAAINEKIVSQLPETFKLAKIPIKELGPAATIEVALNTTSTSTVILKNVYKYGGVLTIAGTAYDVYLDYEENGGLNKGFAVDAAIDISKTVVITAAGSAAVAAGAPLVAVALVGGGVAYVVDKNSAKEFAKGWKEDRENAMTEGIQD